MEVSFLNSCVLQDLLIVLVENTRFDREILDAYKYKVLLGVRKSVLLLPLDHSLLVLIELFCKAILATVVDLVDNYEIDEEVVMRPHTVKFLREVAS